jgi:phage terminase large subunit-like protein
MSEEIVSEDAFSGLTIVSPETHGRYSPLERMALGAREKWGTVAGAFERLETANDEILSAYYDPVFSLRPVQRVPSFTLGRPWRTYFYCGGRGSGKTHAGACAVIEEAQADPHARILIVGPTYTEIQKNQLKGPSGILTLAPPWFKPEHRKNDKQLVFPNGVVADYLPAQDADKFRGYGYSFEWLDEIIAWKRDPVAVFKECLRVGRGITPRMRDMGLSSRRMITTTPAGTPIFREILEDREGLVIGRSTTFDNAANLDPAYIRQARRSAATSPDGRQEYLGDLRWHMDATVYRHVQWDRYRVRSLEAIPPRQLLRLASKKLFDLVVVSVDPATGEKDSSDTHGVVVEGIREEDDELYHSYVLEDRSKKSPDPVWVQLAAAAFHKWKHLAERCLVLVESNTGGSQNRKLMQLHDSSVPVVLVRAGRGTGGSKADRARPVAMLAAAGYVHMVGRHERLEKQLSKFTGAEGGHSRDDGPDAFAWPIYKYVARSTKMRGTVTLTEDDEGEEDSEE